MNTIRSVYYGWGVLILAGGGAYFFAKRGINADRAERAEAEHRRRYLQKQTEAQQYAASVADARRRGVTTGNGNGASDDFAASPSSEAERDPAPTRHAPETLGQKAREKSKYEASEPFRSKKGDRFSGW